MITSWKRERLLGFAAVGLVIFSTVLLLVVLSEVLRGEADRYHNEHGRLVAGAISGILLSLGLLAKSSAKGWFLAAALASVAASVVLAVR